MNKLALLQSVLLGALTFAACAEPSATDDAAPLLEQAGSVALLNVSYDPTRELYAEYNQAFAAHWKAQTGQDVTITQSHGGSGSQAQAVIAGREADVVTLALAPDIDLLTAADLLPADWQARLPNRSAPYTSTIVFVVRKGNPKGIVDWSDLAKPGVGLVNANPKTSGGARWSYLAAWGAALKQPGGSEASARALLQKLLANSVALESGARGATNKFQAGVGDVLISWENEAALLVKTGAFEVVTPKHSILAEPPVAVVDANVEKHGTRAVAEAYLEFLYTPGAQEIIARNGYRPTDAAVSAKFASSFPAVALFTIDEVFGGWAQANAAHFADGASFDQLFAAAQP